MNMKNLKPTRSVIGPDRIRPEEKHPRVLSVLLCLCQSLPRAPARFPPHTWQPVGTRDSPAWVTHDAWEQSVSKRGAGKEVTARESDDEKLQPVCCSPPLRLLRVSVAVGPTVFVFLCHIRKGIVTERNGQGVENWSTAKGRLSLFAKGSKREVPSQQRVRMMCVSHIHIL